MSRIFVGLALFAVLCVGANLLIGLTMGDLNAIQERPSQTTLAWARVHRLLGVGAALAVVFVNSVVVTYFVGTSRWCKEVSQAYQLDPRFVLEGNRLKRGTFPWCVLSMLVAVGIVALGGASDPGTGLRGTADWVTPHLVGAVAGLGFIVWAAVLQWNRIYHNHKVIEAIVAEVQRIRAERGLTVEQGRGGEGR
jgi:hypothetical protein